MGSATSCQPVLVCSACVCASVCVMCLWLWSGSTVLMVARACYVTLRSGVWQVLLHCTSGVCSLDGKGSQ